MQEELARWSCTAVAFLLEEHLVDLWSDGNTQSPLDVLPQCLMLGQPKDTDLLYAFVCHPPAQMNPSYVIHHLRLYKTLSKPGLPFSSLEQHRMHFAKHVSSDEGFD